MSSRNREIQPRGDGPIPASRTLKNAQTTTTDAKPIEPAVRSRFETGFGRDFSDVRVHAGSEAAASARTLGARAFTVGNDIHFAAGRYRPDTSEGQRLIAHELAHVQQQSRGGTGLEGTEWRADHAADQLMRGNVVTPNVVGGAPPGVQRQPDDAADAADSGMSFPLTTLDTFALNSAALTSKHVNDIKDLAWSIGLHAGMRRNPAVSIGVVGHTDRSGTEKVNNPLGQNRADAVKQALVDALTKEGVDSSTFGDIPTSSMGESQPVVPTADGVKNEKNRRVEITVRIGAKAIAAPPPPKFDPFNLPPGSITPGPGPGPRRPRDKMEEMEENERKIREYDRKHPRKKRSLSDVIIDKVMDDIINPIIKDLPISKDLKDKARSAVRKGLEKGTESACEAAVDAAGVTGKEAEGLKAACKAALKEKGEGAGGRRR